MTYDIPPKKNCYFSTAPYRQFLLLLAHVELRRLHWGLRHLFLDESIYAYMHVLSINALSTYDFDFGYVNCVVKMNAILQPNILFV